MQKKGKIDGEVLMCSFCLDYGFLHDSKQPPNFLKLHANSRTPTMDVITNYGFQPKTFFFGTHILTLLCVSFNADSKESEDPK